MIPILDTHLHLLYQERFTYDWCTGLPALNQNFHIDEYQKLISDHGVGASIFIEVDVAENEIPVEARFFSDLVEESGNPLVGVIAACRPENDGFQDQLDEITTSSVVGLRRVLHTMPDELSQSSLFRENIQSLASRNLPFDLCFLERQLPLAHKLAKACPDTRFMLDHCGVPTIDPANFESWKKDLKALAELPNVSCKISGVIAYFAGPQTATLETLRPWLEASVEAFDVNRIVIGSDWPVCNLTTGLPPWLTIVREFFASYSEDELHAIFHRNAESIYRIPSIKQSDFS